MMEERDQRKQAEELSEEQEPDVEAHKAKSRNAEDGKDDEPDVEGHIFKQGR